MHEGPLKQAMERIKKKKKKKKIQPSSQTLSYWQRSVNWPRFLVKHCTVTVTVTTELLVLIGRGVEDTGILRNSF